MRTRALLTLLSAACLSASCAKSDDAASDAAVDAARGDAGDAGDAPLSCDERIQRATNAVNDAVEAASLSCASAADCELIPTDTACHAECGALVSSADRAAIEAVIAEQDVTTCAGFEADGCARFIPPCVPPPPFDCVDQRCMWASEASCLSTSITWSIDGGLVASRKRFTLEPCRSFRAEESAEGDPPVELCAGELPDEGAVTIERINEALMDPEVQSAIADAPVLFGFDPRPIDGTLLRIDIGGAIIDIGRPCDAVHCNNHGQGIARLMNALEQLVTQQHAANPSCPESL